MPTFPESPLLALVGPGDDRPCGIGDYVRRLEAALAGRCRLRRIGYAEALSDPGIPACRALLVHYERSLVPGDGYLRALSARHPGKVFVVPHEVYGEDPFAHPIGILRSAFPPLLWLKRLRYRWRHRAYAREKRRQSLAYHAHRVLPLTREAADILRAAAAPRLAARVLPPIPHARFDPPLPSAAASVTAPPFEPRPRAVAGIFGFLNPGLDYGTVFDLLEALGGDLGLLLLGGDRGGQSLRPALEAEAVRRGLAGRFRITGWLPEDSVGGWLARCDLFLCPFRAKSSSGSLLQLLASGKPILVPDHPLTRFLADEGAPLDLYRDARELRALAESVVAGRHGRKPDRYRWDMDAVAGAYLEAMLAETAAMPAAAA